MLYIYICMYLNQGCSRPDWDDMTWSPGEVEFVLNTCFHTCGAMVAITAWVFWQAAAATGPASHVLAKIAIALSARSSSASRRRRPTARLPGRHLRSTRGRSSLGWDLTVSRPTTDVPRRNSAEVVKQNQNKAKSANVFVFSLKFELKFELNKLFLHILIVT